MPHNHWKLLTGSAVAVALTMGAPALGDGTSSADAATARPTVVLKDISFTPATLRVRKGASVRWSWKDGTTPHNVTFRSRHSATKARGTYVLRFATKGTFKYHCTIHPGMDGKVIVR
jgi:plastocyanin